MQRRFVSDVSHELRTPLTTVRMAGRRAARRPRTTSTPATARSTELLQTQLDRFESLLTDLLEISRYDAGAAVLDAEAVDLRDVRHAGSSRRPSRWPTAGQTGSGLDEPGTGAAEVDPRRVERILRNLLVNAIEHGEGRPVDVRGRRRRLGRGRST